MNPAQACSSSVNAAHAPAEKKSQTAVRAKSVGSVIDARHRLNVDALVMHHGALSVLMRKLSDFDSLCGSMHLHAR